MIRLLALPLALVGLSLIAMPPGTQQAPAEMSVHDRTPAFQTAVNIVEVPVVVRDYKGQAVGTLTKDDFQLFDRGKLQTITKFTLEKSTGPDVVAAMAKTTDEAPSTEAIPSTVLPERFVVYLFDDVHTSTNDLTMAREAADRQVKRSLGEKTRVAIFSTSGQTMLDFTADREKIHEALFRLQTHPIAKDASGHECPELTYLWVVSLEESHAPDQPSIQAAMACSHLPKPQAALLVMPVAARIVAGTEHESAVSLEVLQDLVRRMSVLPGQRTVVLASPGFMTEAGSKGAESFLIDRAIRANVIVNVAADPSLPSEEARIVEPEFRVQAALRMDVMAELANGTGGIFYHNSNDLDTGFDRVAGIPEYRFILGFSPSGLKPDGSLHALKVSIVPNPHHYDVDARRSYSAPKRLDDPVEQAKQEVTAAIFGRDELRDLAIDIHTGFVRLTPERIRLTVNTRVDLKNVKLHKENDRNQGDLTVTAAVFDTNGNYVAGIERGVDLHLKDETLERWLANGIQVPANLEVKPGTYLVRVVVRDVAGQPMASRNGSVNIQ